MTRYRIVSETDIEAAASGLWYNRDRAQAVADQLNELSRTPNKYRVEEATRGGHTMIRALLREIEEE